MVEYGIRYQRNKDLLKKYYEDNREAILERIKSSPDYKEKVKKRNDKMKEYKRKWHQERKNGIKSKKVDPVVKRPEHLSPMTKLDLIMWAIEFVNRVESRRGLVSFEELFGEMINIAFYIPTSEREDKDTIGVQLTKIWADVKYFATHFKKDINGLDPEVVRELKVRNLCKYCESSKIVNTHNTCAKCRNIMIYISKLD